MRLVLSLSLALGALPGQNGDSAAPFSGVDGAALAALRGDPQRARAILGAQKNRQADPGALVVLASIALDEGLAGGVLAPPGRLAVGC